MEYVEGGQVMHWDHKAQRYISPATGGPLPEDVARAYFRDLVTGIDYRASAAFASCRAVRRLTRAARSAPAPHHSPRH